MASSQRPTIRIIGTDQDAPDVTDIIDRLKPSLLMIARLVRLFPEARRLPIGVHDRNLAIALMAGVRTCQTRIVAQNLKDPHMRLQNRYRKSPSGEAAQERHDATGVHGLGQLEALLALGYCASQHQRHISLRLLRPLAERLVLRERGLPEFAKLAPERCDPAFDQWFDRVRNRINRMTKKPPQGEDDLTDRAKRAIYKVDVFLREGQKRP